MPFTLPFMNYTEINEKLSTSEVYAGAYPRWTALSKAFNPLNRKKHTSAFTIIAVSIIIRSRNTLRTPSWRETSEWQQASPT